MSLIDNEFECRPIPNFTQRSILIVWCRKLRCRMGTFCAKLVIGGTEKVTSLLVVNGSTVRMMIEWRYDTLNHQGSPPL